MKGWSSRGGSARNAVAIPRRAKNGFRPPRDCFVASAPRDDSVRSVIALLLTVAVLLAGIGVAAAQSYPVKPVRAIIPAPAGGGVDTIGRAVSQKLGESLGQPFVPDNRPGAGTMIGSELTAKAPADGYTLLFMTNSHAINAVLQKNLK